MATANKLAGKIIFNLNGSSFTYEGNPSERLLDVLRNDLNLTGTKCGFREGECGACAVIIDGLLYNSCLVAMGSLDGSDVVTIEGYSKTGRFIVIDKAYEAFSAVQCGFCTPGMIMASEALLALNPNPSDDEIRVGISGNICRCTGYNSIVAAIGKAASESVPINQASYEESSPDTSDTSFSQDDISYNKFIPTTLDRALVLRKNPNLTPYTGGTDLLIDPKPNAEFFFLHRVPEMKHIVEDDEYIRFGASCTFTEIINHPLTPKVLKEACEQIAAPAIRNAGSIGGNIANGSPKADSALIFMVTDSELRLASIDNERIIPIKDFYLGRNKTALKSDELIVEILMPKQNLDNYYYKKVGPRKALAISRISFVGIIDIHEDRIYNIATAFGAVSDTIIRLPEIDKMLLGETIEDAKKIIESYIQAYGDAIQPIRGRVSIKYRKTVCMNLLRDFLSVLD